jgi:hypothetical protein
MPQAAAGRSPLLIIFVVVFLDLLGFGIVIPILPYYAEAYGANALTLGWLLAIYSAMQLVFAPVWGRLSDAHGRRPILMATILGQGASLLVLGFAPSLAWLFVGRALAGICGANLSTAAAYIADVTPEEGRALAGICGANLSTAAAYIADVTPEEGRARGMGVIGAGFGLGFIFGPAIGGLLSHWGYGTPMFVAAGVALAAALFAWARLPEPSLGREERQRHRRSLDRAAFRESLGDARTRVAILLFFVLDARRHSDRDGFRPLRRGAPRLRRPRGGPAARLHRARDGGRAGRTGSDRLAPLRRARLVAGRARPGLRARLVRGAPPSRSSSPRCVPRARHGDHAPVAEAIASRGAAPAGRAPRWASTSRPAAWRGSPDLRWPASSTTSRESRYPSWLPRRCPCWLSRWRPRGRPAALCERPR